jgi:hypothetical protein
MYTRSLNAASEVVKRGRQLTLTVSKKKSHEATATVHKRHEMSMRKKALALLPPPDAAVGPGAGGKQISASIAD